MSTLTARRTASHEARDEPAAQAPAGTTIRFAGLVLVLVASTASLFAYFWLVAHPTQQSAVNGCIADVPIGPQRNAFARLGVTGLGPATNRNRLLACMVEVAGPMTLWSLAGICLLCALTAAVYLATPWWLTNVGDPGHRGRLVPLDPARYPDHLRRLGELAAEAGMSGKHGFRPGRTVFYVDERDQGTGAQAFGTRRRGRIRLSLGVVRAFTHDGPEARDLRDLFEDTARHEMAHLRNADNRATYVTLAAWRCFVVLISAGYLFAVITSGTTAAWPGIGPLVTVVLLIVLAQQSARAVLRTRELHADATAASSYTARALPALTLLASPADRRAWYRRLGYHPSARDRADTVREPWRLFRADAAALAAAGVGVGLLISDFTPLIFAALIALRMPLVSPTGAQPLYFLLAVYGPGALLGAAIFSTLICAVAWRSKHGERCHPRQYRPRPTAATAALVTAGFLAGQFFGITAAFAGTWGINGADPLDALADLGLAAVLVLLIAAAACRWADAGADAWQPPARTGYRPRFAALALVGSLALIPAMFAVDLIYDIPLQLQLYLGPQAGQRVFISDWPAVGQLFVHDTALGAYDDFPAAALTVGIASLFVAVGAWLRHRAEPGAARERGPASPRTILLGGVAGLAASILVSLAVTAVICAIVPRATDHPPEALAVRLDYFTRVVDVVIACCAAATGLIVTRRATRARAVGAMATALVAATLASGVAPQLIYLGTLNWDLAIVNQGQTPTVYGMSGHVAPAWTIAAVVAALLAGRAVAALRRNRGRPPESTVPDVPGEAATRTAAGLQRAETIVLCVVMSTLILAAYCYLTLDFH
ncbi:MAG TPA: M48 family metalloprotease [Actinocrinis sp.]|jgi:hypothetical protein